MWSMQLDGLRTVRIEHAVAKAAARAKREGQAQAGQE